MYTAQGVPERERLVSQYAPLVKRLAHHLMVRLPASVQVDDLIQNGMIGLLDAMGRFEEGQGAQFETYAVQRIRGAMLDGLRENDWLPRGVRKEMRRIEAAIQKLEHEHGRPPTEKQLAEALGMPVADYQKLLHDARGHQLIYLEDMTGGDDEGYLERNVSSPDLDPLAALEDSNMRAALVCAIENLPEREKMVMALYYEEDLNLREIGQVLEVTESRVCQLHSQAIARLRSVIVGDGGADQPVAKARRGRKPRMAAAQTE